jgi:hydrogenase expression/formation protein HypD
LKPGVILCSCGDMLRVPGTGIDLLTAKARGGDVRIVYSPLDAVALAQTNPTREVVFFAVGFETTAAAKLPEPSACPAGRRLAAALWLGGVIL